MTAVAARPRNSDSVNLVEGEFPFTQADFDQVAKMLYSDAGIHLQESKVALVYSRLAKRLRLLKLSNFAAYCAFVSSPEGKDERGAMLAALTTNVTRFFREPHHFDLLRDQVLTPLATAAKAGQRVRLWSAGCSTGQEPYSMAMTLLSVIPNAAQLDVRILASDIDPNVVATARAGAYNDEAVSPVPASLRDKYMKRDRANGGWVANDELKSLIAFRQLNLIGDWPMKGRFDAIFCRNVVIYFDDATQDRIWARFRAAMAPHARLYVGHSERVTDLGFDSDGLTAYRLKKGGAA